jgi:hypothetical protein
VAGGGVERVQSAGDGAVAAQAQRGAGELGIRVGAGLGGRVGAGVVVGEAGGDGAVAVFRVGVAAGTGGGECVGGPAGGDHAVAGESLGVGNGVGMSTGGGVESGVTGCKGGGGVRGVGVEELPVIDASGIAGRAVVAGFVERVGGRPAGDGAVGIQRVSLGMGRGIRAGGGGGGGEGGGLRAGVAGAEVERRGAGLIQVGAGSMGLIGGLVEARRTSRTPNLGGMSDGRRKGGRSALPAEKCLSASKHSLGQGDCVPSPSALLQAP